ncbi:hypothetical protein FCV25MIE_16145, partial [Fagus crenata]
MVETNPHYLHMRKEIFPWVDRATRVARLLYRRMSSCQIVLVDGVEYEEFGIDSTSQ